MRNDDLSYQALTWLVDSTVLTIMNDSQFYDRAHESITNRGFIPSPLLYDALKASGESFSTKYMLLKQHPTHKVKIRHRIGSEVATQMGLHYPKTVSDGTIRSIADLYQPTVSKVQHDRMKKATYAKAYGSRADTVIFDDLVDGLPVKEEHTLLKEARQHLHNAAVHFEKVKTAHMHKAAEHFNRVKTAHITDPVNNSGNFKILGESLESKMDTTKPARNLTEVFGTVITGMPKESLMEMIRVAQQDVKSFEDLDQESGFVKKQVKSLNDGIKKLYTELDK